MRLDVDAARRAVEEKVAGPMGLSLTDAAWGIHRVVNENMAGAARVHGIERGKDLRAYPLFAFGGAGPVHAWQVGRILKVPRVLVPFGAGAMSAYGLLAAPLAFDFVRTAPQRLDAADWPQVSRLFGEMEAEGRRILRGAEVPDDAVRIRRTAEMHYTGQGHEVEVEVPEGALDAASLAAITANFETAYRALYSRIPMGVPIEALNWRVVVSGPVPDISVSGPKPGAAAARAPRSPCRRPRARRTSPRRAATWTRPSTTATRSRPGATFTGPAIIEERESTTVVGPGARVSVDARLTLILEREKAPDGPHHARHLLEPPDRRRQRAGGGAHAHLVHLDRPRGGRSLGGGLRPARLDGRAGRHRHARAHQLHGARDEAHPRRLSRRRLRARRRGHHQRPLEDLGASQRRHHREPGLPRPRPRRLLRLHLPLGRHRRSRPLGRGARGLRGRALHPDHEAVRGRPDQPRARDHDPRQRARARAGHGRLPRPDRGRRRGRRAPARVHGGVRLRAPRAAVRRDRRPHRARHARGHRPPEARQSTSTRSFPTASASR